MPNCHWSIDNSHYRLNFDGEMKIKEVNLRNTIITDK